VFATLRRTSIGYHRSDGATNIGGATREAHHRPHDLIRRDHRKTGDTAFLPAISKDALKRLSRTVLDLDARSAPNARRRRLDAARVDRSRAIHDAG
jgi:hypothetical protein